MKIRFTGPAGQPFVGAEIDAVTTNQANIDDLAALQRGTKLRMATIMTRLERAQEENAHGVDVVTNEELALVAQTSPEVAAKMAFIQSRLVGILADVDTDEEAEDPSEYFAIQVTNFLALRSAGYKIAWSAARNLGFDDFEWIHDAPPEGAEDDRPEAASPVPTEDPQLPTTDSPQAVVAATPPVPVLSPTSLP